MKFIGWCPGEEVRNGVAHAWFLVGRYEHSLCSWWGIPETACSVAAVRCLLCEKALDRVSR